MKKKILICIVVIILIIAIIAIALGIRVYNNQQVFNEIETAIADMINTGNFSYEVNCSDESRNLSKKVYNNSKTMYSVGSALYYADMETDELYCIDLTTNTYTILSAAQLRIANPEVFINLSSTFSILLGRVNETEDSDNSYTKLLLLTSISTDTVDGVECYKISYLDGTEWFSKETLLPVKYTYTVDSEETVFNYTFSINTVTENDVTFTDIDNYEYYEGE